MTEAGKWRNGLQPRVADEVEYIQAAFQNPPRRKGADRPQKRKIVAVATPDGGLDYMFVEGEILVRDEYLDRVLEILGHPPRRELEQARQNPIRRVIAGVTRLTALARHSTTLGALAAIDGCSAGESPRRITS